MSDRSILSKWYIKVQDKEEGPYFLQELFEDPRLTPMTMVRKEGHLIWLPAYLVKEFREFFRKKPRHLGDQLVLVESSSPPYLDWLVLVLLMVLLWIVFLTFQ